jgi:hypothetical protein
MRVEGSLRAGSGERTVRLRARGRGRVQGNWK